MNLDTPDPENWLRSMNSNMEAIMYYKQDGHKFKILERREINKENFSPMTHNLIDQGYLKDCCQVKINSSLLGDHWITVKKSDIIPISNWNPRYIAYATANGHTPEEMLELDKQTHSGGCMMEFVFWIQDKIKEYKTVNPEGFCFGHLCDQKGFDKFLGIGD